MAQSAYLKSLDARLAAGAALLGREFRDRHLSHVRSRQSLDGGFGGRRGGPDPYYTDFGVRILDLLGAEDAEFAAAGSYLQNVHRPPCDIVDCFNMLNVRRILAQHRVEIQIDTAAIASALESARLSAGGFARKGGTQISAYNTFLGLLCLRMLGRDTSSLTQAAGALAGLRRADGGYGERPGRSPGQTNATAAVVASLTMIGAQDEIDNDAAIRFLCDMQATDGGLRAHKNAPGGDLLSTFTGMVTLFSTGALNGIDLPSAARFVKAVAVPEGGFRACPGDPEADIEYTYYGIGTAALLRLHVSEQRNAEEIP